MSNEELVKEIQAGSKERLAELWEQVWGLVWRYAHRWARRNGTEVEDLVQVGFIAMVQAADTCDVSTGYAFTTWLGVYLKREFAQATGQRTQRDRLDPLQNAYSLDTPLIDDEGAPLTLADTLPDPAAEAELLAIAEQDWAERRRAAVEAAIATLHADEQRAIRRRYYELAPLPPGQTRYSDTAAHAKALRRLRHPSRSQALREYAWG